MKLFDLSIITPDATLYDGKVYSLVAPSRLGYMGVLADHAPLIAILAGGRITLKDGSDQRRVFESKDGGLLEVISNRVTILLSSAH